MQFVLVSLVILPVLPQQDLGPYGVWNPFQIWLMVVLIVGISLTGYIAYKFLGAKITDRRQAVAVLKSARAADLVGKPFPKRDIRNVPKVPGDSTAYISEERVAR